MITRSVVVQKLFGRSQRFTITYSSTAQRTLTTKQPISRGLRHTTFPVSRISHLLQAPLPHFNGMLSSPLSLLCLVLLLLVQSPLPISGESQVDIDFKALNRAKLLQVNDKLRSKTHISQQKKVDDFQKLYDDNNLKIDNEQEDIERRAVERMQALSTKATADGIATMAGDARALKAAATDHKQLRRRLDREDSISRGIIRELAVENKEELKGEEFKYLTESIDMLEEGIEAAQLLKSDVLHSINVRALNNSGGVDLRLDEAEV
jgi:uncharacterized protein YoaH (UPF0181 family)